MQEIAHNVVPEQKAPLFRLSDLSFRYVNGPLVLEGVNLDIAPGERIAIVGQNGSGKTTLIKQLCGLLLPEQGEVRFKGDPLGGEHLDRSRLEIGLLFQDPDDQLFGHTLIDDAAFGPSHQGLSRDEARKTALKALGRVHLADMAYKAPHHLSFGQKKRAALAGLLAMQPSVLLLDEPTANLDPGQEQVFFDLLMNYRGTLVCISHDLLFLYELCERAVVMEKGHVVHDYTMNDLVAQRDELRSHGLDFSFRLQPERNGRGAVCADNDRAVSTGKPTMLELQGYDFCYPDGTRAMSNVDFSIAAGERIALVGENGAGKTTLLSCLLGLREGRGTYLFEDEPVTRRSRKHLWRNIGMVFQDSSDQLFCPSVGEEIAFGLKQAGASKGEIRRHTEEALARVRLEGFEDRIPLHMSGGERKRLALACVLAMSPKLLILDEPSAGLDPQGEELLLSIVGELDVTLLLVSHDMFFVNALTERTVVMHQGAICQDMATDAFFKDPGLSNLNGLAYTFRKRCSDAILALQHEHAHNHPHRHFESRDEQVHAHQHRFMHSHPGGMQPHRHAERLYHAHSHDGEYGDHEDNRSTEGNDQKN